MAPPIPFLRAQAILGVAVLGVGVVGRVDRFEGRAGEGAVWL
jgi:hypothetical protein